MHGVLHVCLASSHHAPQPPPLSQTQSVAEIAALLLLARLVEPIYGSTEFLRMVLVVASASGFAVFAGVYLLYLVAADKDGKVL